MRIPLVIEQLRTILELARASREKALSLLGTVDYLLRFIETAAEANRIGNMPGVRQKLSEYRMAMQYLAGVAGEKDVYPDPCHHARSALGCLAWGSLLGEKPELLQREITEAGEVLHQ